MDATRQGLLSRYHDAARKLVESPLCASCAAKAAPDPDCQAMNSLVKRQAAALLRLHAPRDGANVDEALLQRRLDDLASICMAKFYAYRFDRLPHHWRQIYTDTLILGTFQAVVQTLREGGGGGGGLEGVLDGVVGRLDRALITAGGAGVLGGAWIEKTLELLERLAGEEGDGDGDGDGDGEPGPAAEGARRCAGRGGFFPSHEPLGRPAVTEARLCPRHGGWSLDRFERYMNDGAAHPRPVVFTDLLDGWPALTTRPWKSPGYLLSRTFGGRRLVPVEVGRSYVDPGWGQEIIPFEQLLSRYVAAPPGAAPVGYLAQHDLFRQIPSLRSDVSVPDLCWASVPPHPTDRARDQAPLEAPQLNAWFGPARTITPLHTDGYHNLLAQVVGTKYVRLYPPWARGIRGRRPEHGVDMSNTSVLDLGLVQGWDAEDSETAAASGDELDAARRELEGVEYWECILGEGDTLLIPLGWWHYVRSLSVSFSVSFWWN